MERVRKRVLHIEVSAIICAVDGSRTSFLMSCLSLPVPTVIIIALGMVYSLISSSIIGLNGLGSWLMNSLNSVTNSM